MQLTGFVRQSQSPYTFWQRRYFFLHSLFSHSWVYVGSCFEGLSRILPPIFTCIKSLPLPFAHHAFSFTSLALNYTWKTEFYALICCIYLSALRLQWNLLSNSIVHRRPHHHHICRSLLNRCSSFSPSSELHLLRALQSLSPALFLLRQATSCALPATPCRICSSLPDRRHVRNHGRFIEQSAVCRLVQKLCWYSIVNIRPQDVVSDVDGTICATILRQVSVLDCIFPVSLLFCCGCLERYCGK